MRPTRKRLKVPALVLVGVCASACVAADPSPMPGGPEPVLTASFGADYSGGGGAARRPRGRFAVTLTCPSGDVAVRLTAGDKAFVELELSCTDHPREEFDLAVDQRLEVTFTAVSKNAEGRADLFWLT